MQTAHLAIDLGASSGRAIIGMLGGSPPLLELHEVHRFEHQGLPTPTGPVWNITDIWNNVLTGLRLANEYCQTEDLELTSVGVDTWGVDWVLTGPSGELLSIPHCYRDPQNEAAMNEVLDRVGGFEALFERTGIQRMSINSLFQVYARFQKEPKLFEAADKLLFLPDLFHFWLTGERKVERTIASTSAMLDANTGDWDFELLSSLGLPTEIFGEIVEPGSIIGKLRCELVEMTSSPESLLVITPGSHDTASAIAAIPTDQTRSWAYLSSGTWSLLGAESDVPNTSDSARATPFTNERGIDGTIRLLKNISGLWLIQELRREFNRNEENKYDFEQLTRAAEMAEPFRTLIDPDREEFLAMGNMAEKIRSFAECTGQPIPETVGDFVRCCLESLALCYRSTLAQLEVVTGKKYEVLHIVGGGSQNELLNQFTSNATGLEVVCGPVEATAIGNVLVQAIGGDHIESLSELRTIVSNSYEPNVLVPDQGSDEWGAAFERFQNFFKASTT